MGSRRGFRMMLGAKDREFLVSHPPDCLIVQVDLSDFDLIVIQVFRINSGTVVLRRD